MMKFILSIALASTVKAIHSVSVLSTSPYTCNAVSGIDIAFADDENSITASFPPIALTVEPPAHGYPGGNSSVGCGGTVQFEDWPTGVRFAISDVTWHTGNLNLTAENTLNSLTAKVDFEVEHLTNYYPLHYPLIKDYSSATLLDLEVNPALSDFQGKYELSAKNPNMFWSTCFNGYLDNVTKITFELGGYSVGGGTSQPGWSMGLGLVWQTCYAPNETSWGQKIIKGWESCTYRDTNQTTTAKKSKLLYPMLA
ncbi:hypothetical protein F5Y19DRAFT_25635 [Xylariaceae sp. FL1651]|nr:hypothetical protein F5Y19DRAFT_25635 [Xylariaceae sp. FL1651]